MLRASISASRNCPLVLAGMASPYTRTKMANWPTGSRMPDISTWRAAIFTAAVNCHLPIWAYSWFTTVSRSSEMRIVEVGKKTAHATQEFFARLRRKYYGPITHVQTSANLVALTFDDGPHPKFTIELIRILRHFGAKATFFMVGKAASLNPEVVKLVVEEGHAIGNHSFSHIAFPHLDSAARRDEISRCAEILRPYGTKLFRPPYGVENML